MKYVRVQDLATFLNSSQFKNTITKHVSKKILNAEAERLKKCINQRIGRYYGSYSPQVYERTNRLRDALQINTRVVIKPNGEASISLQFDDYPSQSLLGSSKDDYSVPLLMNYGWNVSSEYSFSNIYRFGNYGGAMFVEAGVQDFLANNPYHLKVEIRQ